MPSEGSMPRTSAALRVDRLVNSLDLKNNFLLFTSEQKDPREGTFCTIFAVPYADLTLIEFAITQGKIYDADEIKFTKIFER